MYLIQRQGMGQFTRRPLENMESVLRYNYNENRGKDPWKYLVEVPREVIESYEDGAPIDRS